MRYQCANASGNTTFFAVSLAAKTNKFKSDLIALARRIAHNLDSLDTLPMAMTRSTWGPTIICESPSFFVKTQRFTPTVV